MFGIITVVIMVFVSIVAMLIYSTEKKIKTSITTKINLKYFIRHI
ncbi:MAG: hypothetical protein ACFWUE_12190 [Xylanivirga thermophila]|jgi:hypothetical protein